MTARVTNAELLTRIEALAARLEEAGGDLRALRAEVRDLAMAAVQASAEAQARAERLERLEKEMREVQASIKGNGKPGMALRLDRVERAVKEWEGVKRWLVGAIGSALVTAVLNLIISVRH